MTKITPEMVRHVALLARLQLEERELANMTTQLNSILDYVDMMKELDTSSVQEMPLVDSIETLREDEIKPSVNRDALLKLAPEATEEAILVPKVIE
ncbi:MAG: Asp-tRNA(Asn)/Glu-tRNA(Gln) amidotransferase subunit GatC [Deltaproteobacteria bacterium]|nr:Asp-tRNA(Asn)/Glu-tRNA(Gln) amidotransferase subunit GatC [Deltaproteobacteria bacterium]